MFTEIQRRPTECVICRRPANCLHYGVESCKGCKTFFRRMCVSNTKLECKLGHECFSQKNYTHINLRCQACRFRKCTQMGMRASALDLKDEDKEALKRFTETENSLAVKRLNTSSLNSLENLPNRLIQNLIYLENKLEAFRMSAYNPDFFELGLGNLTEMLQSGSKFSLADKLGPMPGWPIPKEQVVLEEKFKISNMRDVPDTTPKFSTDKKVWMLFNTFTTVEYIKTFDFFHQLKNRDKLILVGHVTLLCMYFHISYFVVSQKVDACLHPDGSEAPLRDESHYSMTIMSHAPLIRCDIQKEEYVLLKAICLCNPTIHDLSEHAQTILMNERQKYAKILFDHCQKTRNDGPNRFVELLGIVPILEQQQQASKNFFIFRLAPIIAKYEKIADFFHDIMFS